MTSADPYDAARQAADAVRSATQVDNHDVAIVLGSGWAGAADRIGTVRTDLELSALPGFPPPAVAGHRNLLRSISAHGRDVLVFGGRSHLYEGHPASTVVHGIRTAAAAGCRTVIITNAAGGLDPTWPVGTLVLIEDQINLTGHSPMVGPPPPDGQPGRFCDLTDAYSPRLRAVAHGLDDQLADGIYAGLIGGNYETPAEIRMLATMGADLVGMSTVLETIAARHLGLEVLGISLVTNLAAGLSPAALAHEDVLAAAREAETRVVDLIGGVLAEASPT
ncbi:MAG: purine-nucleoside phosphorylase [Acidimicrobiales bacterium]